MRITSLILLFGVFTHSVVAQTLLQGKIINSANQQAIDYVNIGIIDKAQGTVSDDDGSFNLIVYEASPDDIVQISRIGYAPIKISFEELQARLESSPVIEMEETRMELQEVVVSQEDAQKNRVGYTRTTDNLVAYWNNSQALGGEHASKIMVRKGPVKLEDLSFQIVKSISDSLLVRVNLYEIDKGLPGRNISKYNILYTIKKKSGRVIIDLSPYNLVVDDHFIVSLEMLKVYGGKVGMTIAAYNDGHRSYSRTMSQDRWRKMRHGTTIAFNLNTSAVKEFTTARSESKKKIKKPEVVNIIWDHSLSMDKKDLDKELSYLDTFFKKVKQVRVHFLSLGYEDAQTQIYNISKGEWGDLKAHIQSISYDGSIRRSTLDNLTTGDFTLVFTDGKSFYKDINRNWEGKIFTINSQVKAEHELLAAIAEESGGAYVNLAQAYDEDRAADYQKMEGNYVYRGRFLSDEEYKLRTIRGNVSDFDEPIQGVQVSIKGYNRETVTDLFGNFTIKGMTGETLEFTYPGRKKVEATINDGVNNYSITMPMGTQILDEVVLSKDRKLDSLSAPLYRAIASSFGTFDPEKSGFSVKQIDGSKLDMGSPNILVAITGKFPGVRIIGGGVLLRVGSNKLAGWDVDGRLYPSSNPPLDVNIQTVESITIMQGSWAFARYGNYGAGGIIIVRTVNDPRKVSLKNNEQSSESTNLYKEEAVFPENNIWSRPKYIQEIDKAVSEAGAYELYLGQRENWRGSLDFYVNVYKHFKDKWQAKGTALKILSNIEEEAPKDINALRLLAFYYEEEGEMHKALETYREISELSPLQLQSKRDLAKAHLNAGEIDIAWLLYDQYLISRKDKLGPDGLDKIVRQEMLDLVATHGESLGFNMDYFQTEEEKEDISIIVQWNNPNAEFELQFVGPDRRFYTWKHTSEDNDLLLTEEREKGIFSRSFGIQDIGKGPWLINSRYLGNKEGGPTYLKFTIRDNKNLKETIKVHTLQKSDINYRSLNISEKDVQSFFK